MRELVPQKKIPRGTLKSRKQEIEHCLVNFGLMRGPRYHWRRETVDISEARTLEWQN